MIVRALVHLRSARVVLEILEDLRRLVEVLRGEEHLRRLALRVLVAGDRREDVVADVLLAVSVELRRFLHAPGAEVVHNGVDDLLRIEVLARRDFHRRIEVEHARRRLLRGRLLLALELVDLRGISCELVELDRLLMIPERRVDLRRVLVGIALLVHRRCALALLRAQERARRFRVFAHLLVDRRGLQILADRHQQRARLRAATRHLHQVRRAIDATALAVVDDRAVDVSRAFEEISGVGILPLRLHLLGLPP